jgi:peptide deformylase
VQDMAILKIVTEENPVLRQKSKEITQVSKRVKILVKNMLETLYDAPGVGLAAPQVGVLERIIVIDVGDGPIVLINPQILSREGENRDVEGCLSIPGRNEYITRANKVVVTGMDLNGKKVKLEGSGLLARAFQHEIDHLNGILFIDYLTQ